MSVWGLAWGPYWGNSWGSVGGGTVIPGDCVLSRLAIAVQGVGYGYRLTATQGLWCVVEKPPVDPDCALSPMAIAMQGIGFGRHLAAVQGLWCVLDYLTPEERIPDSGGGGALTKPKHDKAAQRFLEQIREEDALLIALIDAAWEQGLV